ncbi:MAG: polysaccharide deacetylase family protein [Halanaerobacter sp.]
MGEKKIKFFFLPLNKKVIFSLILVVILVSYGLVELDNPEPEQAVFQQQPKAYYQGPQDKNEVAFAINVAWGTEYIPEILDILKKEEATATFFLVGNWVEKFPELVVEIKEEGHELGNHGYRHRHPQKLAEEALIALIKKNENLIQETADYKTELFAPPYGEVDQRIVKVAHKVGYKTIMWTVDTIDWQRPEPEVIIKRVVPKAEKGAIILMHPTEPTVKALPAMIKGLEEKGYKLVTISELLSK